MINRNRAADLAALYADAASALLGLASAARLVPADRATSDSAARDADAAVEHAVQLLASAHSIARNALPPRVGPADDGGDR
jgi:hypothetical protein